LPELEPGFKAQASAKARSWFRLETLKTLKLRNLALKRLPPAL
jgi:hypothetical protein